MLGDLLYPSDNRYYITKKDRNIDNEIVAFVPVCFKELSGVECRRSSREDSAMFLSAKKAQAML